MDLVERFPENISPLHAEDAPQGPRMDEEMAGIFSSVLFVETG